MVTNSTDHSQINLRATTRVETGLDIAATVASLAPWIGGPISNILGGISTGRKMDRINSCFQELGRRIESVHNRTAEEFVKTEEFADLLEETLRRVALERNKEKRRLYGDFLVNNIGHPNLDYERRLKMLKVLEDIRMSHVAVLKALAQTPTRHEADKMMGSVEDTLSSRAPEVAGEMNAIAKDLERLDLSANLLSSMKVMMTGHGAAELRSRITDFGRQFMDFLRSENEGEANK